MVSWVAYVGARPARCEDIRRAAMVTTHLIDVANNRWEINIGSYLLLLAEAPRKSYL